MFMHFVFEPHHAYAACKTKVQIMINIFVLATQYNSSSTYTQIFKILAFFCECIGQFVLDLVENPEELFLASWLI